LTGSGFFFFDLRWWRRWRWRRLLLEHQLYDAIWNLGRFDLRLIAYR
jgi:hypothetical protein